jgi:cysteine synthase
MLAGYGTLALEIVDQVPNVDAVLLSVGSGGLAAALTTTIKALKPNCLVYVSIHKYLLNFTPEKDNRGIPENSLGHPITQPMRNSANLTMGRRITTA